MRWRSAASRWAGGSPRKWPLLASAILRAWSFLAIRCTRRADPIVFAHSTWLIAHVAVVFYTLLAAQCLVSLLRGDPWTAQFTRRVVTPEFLTDPRFRVMNVRATVVWAVAFVACDILALALHGAVSIWLPVCVMVAAVVASRVMGRRVASGGAGHDATAR